MDPHPVSFEPEFTLYDGLRIRYVASPRPAAESVMLLSPWPESIYAFIRIWPRLSEEFSLAAVDLPGFGQSDGRADLMSPRRMGEFVVQIADQLGLGQPHAVGPDIGTGALLCAAAQHPAGIPEPHRGGRGGHLPAPRGWRPEGLHRRTQHR